MRRAYGHKMVESTLVRLQVFQASPCDNPSQRMTNKADLVLLELDIIQKILDLDSQPMSRLLNILLSPSLIDIR